jgi:transcriptional regulator with XRE-family HTH domain
MATPPIDPEKVARAERLIREGNLSTRSIAAQCGLSAGSVSKIRNGKGDVRLHEPDADAVEEMRQAARAEPDNDWDEDPAAVWAQEEKRAKKAIAKAKGASTFRWTAPGKHLLLTVLSDMHIGGSHVDYTRMRQDAELIRDTPNCYGVLVGDQVDNHVKHRGAMLNAEMAPSKQFLLFEYWLRIAGEKLLVVTSGNHDDWTVSHAGVDMLGRIVRDRRVFYSPNEAWLELGVGGRSYTVGVRHQYRLNSSFNQTHSVKQWLRLGDREFDIGVIGHHHEAAVESTLYRGRHRFVARPGSYQITSGYSDQLGYNHAVPTCPTFLLRGDAHGITAWNSLRDVGESVKAVRELGVV